VAYLIGNKYHLLWLVDGFVLVFGHFGNTSQVGLGVSAGDVGEIEDGWLVGGFLG
jgi:hypothetical protein